MPFKVPLLSDVMVFAGDPKLAAQTSTILAKPGFYVPIVEGPRMQRPDHEGEIVRANNTAATSRARGFIFAGLDEPARTALERRLPRALNVKGPDELSALRETLKVEERQPMEWGCDRIGIGLLKALYSKRTIKFGNEPSPCDDVPTKSNHLVVCEDGDELAQVIAANYAYSLRAGLVLIPPVEGHFTEDFIDRFYTLYDDGQSPPDLTLKTLQTELRARAGNIPVPPSGSITFIGQGLPYGFAFPEVPSTHLISYPNLGRTIVNGFAAEQPKSRGVQVAALVDPGTTPAPEISAAIKSLAERRTFVRVYESHNADVTSIEELIELFPYDLLLIATHCGDTEGMRWTYEFTDSEGIARTLVVDKALGIGRTNDSIDGEELLNVIEFNRFVSLDGIAWNDPIEKSKLYVGNAIADFVERSRDIDNFKPTKRGTSRRVVGSAALKMSDGNLIFTPRSVAAEGNPVIINNACASWHRLAGDFLFAGARGYVGILFPIVPTEAAEIATRALGKHHGKDLPHALWSAQREVYGVSVRRPYLVAGVYTQRIRNTPGDFPAYIVGRLMRGHSMWTNTLKKTDQSNPQRTQRIRAFLEFYERELQWFRQRWPPRRR
jgi:hypothetical protein